ncbi:MAG TPA: hypothetical protein VFZ66_09120 [Herpetosiphonaceae bacterium]
MATASIQLSDQEMQALRELAEQTGKTEDELLHEAISRLLAQVQPTNRIALLRQARGIWKARTDLPEVNTLRTEFERFSSQE